MKNIVTFKVDKKVDFKNHLIGMRSYQKRRPSTPEFVKYYNKLRKSTKNTKSR
ncbi:MAG: hypothetical protein QGH85_00765 [Candidatus Pacebacteria bacterium]|jgi:hypothetical protein|nr:hypothetical protein [Candidatus Paceibacterota bacterium]MDP7365801.1 hypothetical protein [Candidatus Paceibacterota bacterium]MDP7466147.1 hypothetical protein [Candidatus Paceibacterota bacterium]